MLSHSFLLLSHSRSLSDVLEAPLCVPLLPPLVCSFLLARIPRVLRSFAILLQRKTFLRFANSTQSTNSDQFISHSNATTHVKNVANSKIIRAQSCQPNNNSRQIIQSIGPIIVLLFIQLILTNLYGFRLYGMMFAICSSSKVV